MLIIIEYLHDCYKLAIVAINDDSERGNNRIRVGKSEKVYLEKK